MKRIAPGAYQALREALAKALWYKRNFETYLRMALRDHPELLAGLTFGDVRRWVAHDLVDRLANREDRYQQVTLQLMIEIASMESSPDLESPDDAETRVADAQKAVAELRRWTQQYADAISEREKIEAELAAATQQAETARRFSDELEVLQLRFMELFAMRDPHERGHALEGFLDQLFDLIDLEPRLKYELDHEEIDGSFSFDTDAFGSRVRP